MKAATSLILNTLRDRGYRATSAREEIITVLAALKQPTTIQSLAAQVSTDEVSVYRTVELLQAEGLLEAIAVAGEKTKYSLTHGHHHHVVCTECGLVAHVPCDTVPTLTRLPKEFAAVDGHEVTYLGRCQQCV